MNDDSRLPFSYEFQTWTDENGEPMHELNEMFEAYTRMFDDSFPTIPLQGYSHEEWIEIMKDCISKKKNVWDAGYLTLSPDIKY